jgi:Fe/S biogenesis protein NfuA
VRFSDVSWVLMTDAPLLTITDAAREKILDVRAGEPDGDALALWFDVSGVEGNSFTYDMYFRPVDEAGADDAVQSDPDIPVVVPGESADKVRGSTLDLAAGGMVLRNPNGPSPAPPTAAAEPPKDLSGPVAQRVLQVLDEQVNPAIAAHGGRADLVAVEEPVAYLHLSGGCQGCGMAAVTLRQGIEAMIFEAVPEITEVVDATDHASGTNPYYKAD